MNYDKVAFKKAQEKEITFSLHERKELHGKEDRVWSRLNPNWI